MARGKYAAKAANRLAALDNELLAEKVAEVETLQAVLADIQKQLSAEQRSRQAEIIRRADELAAHEISLVKVELQELKLQHRQERHRIAHWLVMFLRDIDKQHNNELWLVPDDIDTILADLVGNQVGDYLTMLFEGVQADSRRYRRRTTKNLRHAREKRGVNASERQSVLLDKFRGAGDDEEE